MAEELIIQLNDTFDATAARALTARLTRMPAEAKVVLDLSRAVVQDAALAILSDAVGKTPLVLRRLDRHQRLILGYLGVKTAH